MSSEEINKYIRKFSASAGMTLEKTDCNLLIVKNAEGWF